ncbi:hypothetical protein MGSAQ_000715 [marine sediment metagenome]|uniref:Uncharacterized protein n=1 Tax=marine sediment metagenome TaxID=412755 RepID=A0A1B6NWR0_9ZZZZ
MAEFGQHVAIFDNIKAVVRGQLVFTIGHERTLMRFDFANQG